MYIYIYRKRYAYALKISLAKILVHPYMCIRKASDVVYVQTAAGDSILTCDSDTIFMAVEWYVDEPPFGNWRNRSGCWQRNLLPFLYGYDSQTLICGLQNFVCDFFSVVAVMLFIYLVSHHWLIRIYVHLYTLQFRTFIWYYFWVYLFPMVIINQDPNIIYLSEP